MSINLNKFIIQDKSLIKLLIWKFLFKLIIAKITKLTNCDTD